MSVNFTLGAAGPPQTRVGQDLLVLVDGLVVVRALGAAHPTGVQPVVRAHSDGHEAEGAKSPRCGQKHHHTPVAHPHVGLATNYSSARGSPPDDGLLWDSESVENQPPASYLCGLVPVG